MSEPQSEKALKDMWTLAGNNQEPLNNVRLTGIEPSLPSIYKTGILAQSTIAAAALSAATLLEHRIGKKQTVTVDIDDASASFRSESYLTVEGKTRSEMSNLEPENNIHGFYKCADDGWVQLHANYPKHRKGIIKHLGCGNDRKSVTAKIQTMTASEVENTLNSFGLPVGKMRTSEEWNEHEQGKVIASRPLFSITKIGEADPIQLPTNPKRPLEGIKTLEFTKVIAGPLIGRTLAEHGADVLWINGPHLDLIDSLVIDMARGKRPANLDLRLSHDQTKIKRLVKDANIFIQGYRPGAIASKGLSPEELAEIKPGIIYVNLSAFGTKGPWKARRGFDSIVQTVSGIGHDGGKSAGIEGMKHLPCQALDHGTGYIGVLGAISALQKQLTEGGSWLVDISLAQTGHYLTSLGRQNKIHIEDTNRQNKIEYLEKRESPFGTVEYTKPAAILSETPGGWDLPPSPFGTYSPEWW